MVQVNEPTCKVINNDGSVKTVIEVLEMSKLMSNLKITVDKIDEEVKTIKNEIVDLKTSIDGKCDEKIIVKFRI